MGWWKEVFDARIRRILGESSWMLAATATSAVFGVVQVLLVTRLLGPELYGRLAIIMAIAQTIRQVISIRLWEWAMKEFADAYTHKDAGHAGSVVRFGYRVGFLINLISFVVVVASASFAADRFVHDRNAMTLVIGYGLVLLASWTHDTSFAVLRVVGEFRLLARQQVTMSLLRAVVTGASVLVWRRLDTTIVAYLVIELTASVWLTSEASRAFSREMGTPWWRTPRVGWTRGGMAKLIAIGSVMDTLKVAAGRLDVLVLGWYRNPIAVANYQAAWNFLDVAQRVTQPLTMVVFADLAKLGAAGQSREVLRLVGKLSLLAVLVTIPACTALYFAAPLLCRIAYGSQYPEAAVLLQWLAFSLVWLTGLWMLPSFVSLGKPGWGLEVVVINTAVKVGVMLALVPSLGARGVAIANLASCISVPLLIPIYFMRMRSWVASEAYAARMAAIAATRAQESG